MLPSERLNSIDRRLQRLGFGRREIERPTVEDDFMPEPAPTVEDELLKLMPPDFGQCKVYFIECEAFIKIGITMDIQQRLRSLEGSNPFPLTLRFAIDGGKELEAELHQKFQQFRHRGEWFHKCPELLERIDALRPAQ